jgi:hypothetical protein
MGSPADKISSSEPLKWIWSLVLLIRQRSRRRKSQTPGGRSSLIGSSNFIVILTRLIIEMHLRRPFSTCFKLVQEVESQDGHTALLLSS